MQLVITSTSTDAALPGRDELGCDGRAPGLLCCKEMLGGAEKKGAVLHLQCF